MNVSREDLSEWALHFIHDYNPEAEPNDSTLDFDHFEGFPYHQDKKVNDRFDAWTISDEYYPIDPDPSALQVLLKIITDGHIRASWAFRNGRPTISMVLDLLFALLRCPYTHSWSMQSSGGMTPLEHTRLAF